MQLLVGRMGKKRMEERMVRWRHCRGKIEDVSAMPQGYGVSRVRRWGWLKYAEGLEAMEDAGLGFENVL